MPAQKTQNPPEFVFFQMQLFSVQPPSHLVDAAVVRPGEVLPDGGDEGVVVEEARQPERGGKAGLQNRTGWTSTKTSRLSQARLNIKMY